MNEEWVAYRCPVCRLGVLFESQGPVRQTIRRVCRNCKQMRYIKPPHESEHSHTNGPERPTHSRAQCDEKSF